MDFVEKDDFGDRKLFSNVVKKWCSRAIYRTASGVHLLIHCNWTVPLLHAVAGSLLSLVIREFEPAAIAAS